MVSFEAATAITPESDDGSTFRADLASDWEIWGPQGGYLASVALRAAGAVCDRARPASLSVHFVGAGSSGPVRIEVSANRATRVGTSVSVRLTQPSERGDRLLLVGTVWGVDDDLPGLEHRQEELPLEHMSPEGIPSIAERMAGRDDAGPPHPFWLNFEQRPLAWVDDWENREAAAPRTLSWYRLVEDETYDDPWLDAGRLTTVLDVDSWGAATRPHTGELEHFAPTIELAVRFVGDARNSPWLLSDATSPVASDGLVAHTGTIWTPDGRIVATGGSTLLCRPAARRPD